MLLETGSECGRELCGNDECDRYRYVGNTDSAGNFGYGQTASGRTARVTTVRLPCGMKG
jgi:hypothetical protein